MKKVERWVASINNIFVIGLRRRESVVKRVGFKFLKMSFLLLGIVILMRLESSQKLSLLVKVPLWHCTPFLIVLCTVVSWGGICALHTHACTRPMMIDHTLYYYLQGHKVWHTLACRLGALGRTQNIAYMPQSFAAVCSSVIGVQKYNS